MEEFRELSPGVFIGPSDTRDAALLAPLLRKRDLDEIRATSGRSPVDVLLEGISESDPCYTVVIHGEISAVVGVNPEISPGISGIWMLGSDALETKKKTFFSTAKKLVSEFLEKSPVLVNYVHAKNSQAVSLLMRLGAKIEGPMRWGVSKEDFFFFTLSREGFKNV